MDHKATTYISEYQVGLYNVTAYLVAFNKAKMGRKLNYQDDISTFSKFLQPIVLNILYPEWLVTRAAAGRTKENRIANRIDEYHIFLKTFNNITWYMIPS